MIDAREVDDAVLAALEAAVAEPGRLHTAPAGTPALYFTVEVPPGSERSGSLGLPEQSLEHRVRLRAVCRHTDAEQAARAASDLLGRLAAVLLDRSSPIAGDGWEVSGRTSLSLAGTDVIGQVANAIEDFELHVSAAS